MYVVAILPVPENYYSPGTCHVIKMSTCDAWRFGIMENVDTIRGANMEVDTMFDSFSALEKEIDNFQKRNSVQFYMRDSRKIEAAKRALNTRLVYSEIVYCCIHGGKTFKSESKGERPNQLYVNYTYYFESAFDV